MPKLPNFTLEVEDPASDSPRGYSLGFSVTVTGDGKFHVNVPAELGDIIRVMDLPSMDTSAYLDSLRGTLRLNGRTLAGLQKILRSAMQSAMAAEKTVERVILYNIESHISFAQDEKGGIFPNSGYPGTRWISDARGKRFGGHHAQDPAKGGYSLILGARAYDKVTLRRGESTKVEYRMPEGVNHHGNESPIEMLNSWCSFTLPKGCKEMPYSDEAALFFHNLMLGMAQLSLRVQDFFHDEQRLLAAIQNGALLLQAPKESV